jgi:hypothetical protein
MIIMASASGTLVPAIARLVAADEDTVRDVIHAFNAKGLAALDPRWAGGRPRLISDGDIEVIVTAARTRPEKPVQPFTHWSLRELAGYLAAWAGRCGSGGSGCGSSFTSAASRSSGPGPGRNPPIRTGVDPALPRRVLGAAQTAGPAARGLSSHPRHPLLPWLLLRGR